MAPLRAVRPVVVAPRFAVVAVRLADLRAEVTVPWAPALVARVVLVAPRFAARIVRSAPALADDAVARAVCAARSLACFALRVASMAASVASEPPDRTCVAVLRAPFVPLGDTRRFSRRSAVAMTSPIAVTAPWAKPLRAWAGHAEDHDKEMNMARPRWIIATIAVGALSLAATACGDDDDAAPEEPPTAATDSTAQSGESAAESPATVVDVAATNDDFSTLVTAVETAGLVETLNGDGPFTVFAPVNDAFAALPAGTLDTLLLPENEDQLTAVLTYHVVPQEAMSEDLSDGMTITTVKANRSPSA
jgi:hypothetical protein